MLSRDLFSKTICAKHTLCFTCFYKRISGVYIKKAHISFKMKRYNRSLVFTSYVFIPHFLYFNFYFAIKNTYLASYTSYPSFLNHCSVYLPFFFIISIYCPIKSESITIWIDSLNFTLTLCLLFYLILLWYYSYHAFILSSVILSFHHHPYYLFSPFKSMSVCHQIVTRA